MSAFSVKRPKRNSKGVAPVIIQYTLRNREGVLRTEIVDYKCKANLSAYTVNEKGSQEGQHTILAELPPIHEDLSSVI